MLASLMSIIPNNWTSIDNYYFLITFVHLIIGTITFKCTTPMH